MKFLFWLMDNNPEEIKSRIKFITREYQKLKKEKPDADKLHEEIMIEFEVS